MRVKRFINRGPKTFLKGGKGYDSFEYAELVTCDGNIIRAQYEI